MKFSLIIGILLFPIFIFSQQAPNLIPFKKDQLWGFAEKDGTIQIDPQYDKVEFFGRGDRARVWKNKCQGFINPAGEKLVEFVYQETIPIYFGENLFIARKGKKWGVVNSANSTLLKLQYDKIEYFGNPFLKVNKNGLFGLYKLVQGKFIEFAPIKYTKIEGNDFSKRKYAFKGITKDGFKEYIDKNGKVIKRTSQKKASNQASGSPGMDEMEMSVMEEVEPYHEPKEREKYPKSFPFDKNGKKGVIVLRSNNNIYQNAQVFTDTLFGDFQEFSLKHSFSDAYVFKQNGKWGAMNLSSKILIPVEYDSIDINSMKFQSGGGQTFIVKKNGKWGVIGNANKFRKVGAPTKIKIPFEYDSIRRNVNHTYYIVSDNNQFGIINSSNFKLIVKPKYYQIKDTFRRVKNFAVFSIIMENGDEVYVGENGVEFFSSK